LNTKTQVHEFQKKMARTCRRTDKQTYITKYERRSCLCHPANNNSVVGVIRNKVNIHLQKWLHQSWDS